MAIFSIAKVIRKDFKYKIFTCPVFKPQYSSEHIYGLNNKPGFVSADGNDYAATNLLDTERAFEARIFMDSISNGGGDGKGNFSKVTALTILTLPVIMLISDMDRVREMLLPMVMR